MSNWLTAQGGAGQMANQGIQNQFNAMGQLGNVQNNKMFDANQQQQVGQTVDTATQNQINDLINQWTQGDMSGWAKRAGCCPPGPARLAITAPAAAPPRRPRSPAWRQPSAASSASSGC